MNKLHIIALCFVLFVLALVACSENLFGSPTSNNCSDTDNQCLRLDAENAFRAADYEKAYKLYEKITENNPTASVGYFGMAKAGLWMKNVNPFDVLRFVKFEDDDIPFMNEDVRTQNRYYQGMRKAAVPLSELERRDSLTILYDFHKRDSLNSIPKDTMFSVTIKYPDAETSVKETWPLTKRLLDFRTTFCKAGACKDTTKTKELPFPLTDKEFRSNTYSGGLFISSMAKTLLSLLDINNDGCIARRGKKGTDNPGDLKRDFENNEAKFKEAWKNWGCWDFRESTSYDISVNLLKDKDGNLIIDLDQFMLDMEDMLDDYYDCVNDASKDFCEVPDDIKGLNDRVDKFNGDLEEVRDLLGSFETGEEKSGWQDEVDKYKAYSSFYKVGTNIDEDGDGCIGEDLLDGMDNDGDGLKNANARMASTDPDKPDRWGVDNLSSRGLHSMSGMSELDKPIKIPLSSNPFICNAPWEGEHCPRQRFLEPSEPKEGEEPLDYVVVMKFTQETGYWTSDDLDDKLKIAQDTICPPKYSLEERKELIGGCWPNYDEEKFVRYWLKRELASPQDQINRVHRSCRDCNGAECLK